MLGAKVNHDALQTVKEVLRRLVTNYVQIVRKDKYYLLTLLYVELLHMLDMWCKVCGLFRRKMFLMCLMNMTFPA